MPWIPPALPLNTLEARLAYWQSIATIPDNEPGAQELRDMAEGRVAELLRQRSSGHRFAVSAVPS
jgi:hypothetical protein